MSRPKANVELSQWRRIAQRARYQPGEFGKQIGLHPRTLQRACLREFGCTPREWLNTLRQERARKLARAGFTTRSIARMLGYVSIPMFCREFKRFYGQTVGQCRGERPRQIGAPPVPPSSLEK